MRDFYGGGGVQECLATLEKMTWAPLRPTFSKIRFLHKNVERKISIDLCDNQ